MSEEEKKEEKTQEESKKEEEEIEVPKKFEKIVKEIESLSVLDLAELVKVLEKKFGVSATPQVVAAAPGVAAGTGEAAPEKSVFTVQLTAIGDKKIEVIKAVRDITQKGLKEAKDLVDAVANGPQVIKENVKKEEAEELKKKLEAAGAKVELK
ncbi:50S ribosomal protein L7/L12 [bacterium]|nr:50S ribosomal protein L7/L12 [bacterium]